VIYYDVLTSIFTIPTYNFFLNKKIKDCYFDKLVIYYDVCTS